MDEKELILRIEKKDRAAQKYLFEKYSALFFGICLRYASTSDEADDILQEGFIRIFLNIKKFSGSGSFEGWMKKIIVNNAINHYHRYYKHRFHADVADIKEEEIIDNKAFEQEFSYEELLKIIRDLPQGYKQIFNLYAIEGFKHKEIAKMLKISESTSKSQYHRAKLILQEKLNKIIEQRKKIKLEHNVNTSQ